MTARPARRHAGRATRERTRALEDELHDLNARRTARGTVVTLGDVLFETDHAELTAGAMRDLDRLVAVLRREPDRQLTIEGHTDDTGAADYNRRLSQARADAVRDYLVSRGIGADRIVARGLGESYPGEQCERGRTSAEPTRRDHPAGGRGGDRRLRAPSGAAEPRDPGARTPALIDRPAAAGAPPDHGRSSSAT